MVDEVEKTASNLVTSETLEAYQAEKLGLNKKEPQAEVTEDPPKAEDSDEEVEEAKEEPKEEDHAKKPNSKIEKRFSELTQQREEARREALAEKEARLRLEERLNALEGKAPPKEETKVIELDTKPNPANYTDAFKYAEDLTKWEVNQAFLTRETQQKQKEVETQQKKVVETWETRLQEFKKNEPEFDEVVNNSNLAVSDEVRDSLITSEVGPQILLHFAQNPEVVQLINNSTLADAMKIMGRLEAKFEKSPVTEKNVKQPDE